MSENTPTNTSSLLDEQWTSRINAAAAAMNLDPNKVSEALIEFGITSVEMLDDDEVTPFGDIRKVFGDNLGVKLPQIRLAQKFLRGSGAQVENQDGDPAIATLVGQHGIHVRFEDLSSEDLFPHYSPRNHNAIYQVLKERFQEKKVIVFQPDTEDVAVQETLNYITDLESGYPASKSVMVNGEMCALYAIGEVPDKVVPEDPMFSGQPLQSERSMHNRVNYAGIEHDERVFIHLLVQQNEVNPNDRIKVRDLARIAKDESIDGLKDIYPEIYAEFKKRKKTGRLPSLQMTLRESQTARGSTQGSFMTTGGNYPFNQNRRY